MSIVNGINLINTLLAGDMSGTALQTHLDTGANRAAFLQAINVRSQARVLVESSTAMAAVVASSNAMTAVAASSTAMNIVAANSTAKLAIHASDTALNAIGASVMAMNVLFNHSSAATAEVETLGSIAARSFLTNIPTFSKLYLAIGTMTSSGGTGNTHTIGTRRVGSGIATTLTTDGSNNSNNGFKYFAAPVPIANPMTIQTTQALIQTMSVRLINCSDNTVYA